MLPFRYDFILFLIFLQIFTVFYCFYESKDNSKKYMSVKFTKYLAEKIDGREMQWDF